MTQKHVTDTVTPIIPKTEEVKQKPNLRYMRDRDREKVKGIFKFYEVPGGSMDFVFKQYKEDDVERYNFVDGNVYTVPLGVAKHLNKNGWYPTHVHAVDANGMAIAKIGQKVHRFGFQSLEFIDVEEMSQHGEIITVENV